MKLQENMRPITIKFGPESDKFFAKLLTKSFVSILFVSIVAIIQILMYGFSLNNIFLLVGAIISGLAIFGYLFVVMGDVKAGRPKKNISSILLLLSGFVPYCFGSYLFFYKGIWQFTWLINRFDLRIILSALFYLFSGYMIVLGIYRVSEFTRAIDEGRIIIKTNIKNAVIVSDMVNDFIDPKGNLYLGDHARKLIPFIQEKITEARARDEPVIFHYYTNYEKENPFKLKTMDPPGRMPGTWGAAIVAELEPNPQDFIVETSEGSVVYNRRLNEILTKEQVDQVAIMGVVTQFRISQIAFGLLAKGFRVVVFRQGFREMVFTDGAAEIVENHQHIHESMLGAMGVKVIYSKSTG